MRRKAASGIMLMLLFICMLTLAFNVQPVKSDWTWTETIYIRADGSVEPDTAPISSDDNITYTFTDNIVGYFPTLSRAIVVERNNIVVNGAGYAVQAIVASLGSAGMNLTGGSNVTIQNMEIKGFDIGIYLHESSNNTIYRNNITFNQSGIMLWDSSNNTISGNNITNNGYGIYLTATSNYNNIIQGNVIANNNFGTYVYWRCPNTTIHGNTITNNLYGIYLVVSPNSRISENNIANNGEYGIYLEGASNCTISGNNITASNYGIMLTVGKPPPNAPSDYNSIFGNIIKNNEYGIMLYKSSNNRFFHNNFMCNTQHVYIAMSGYANFWDDGYPSGGNYWGDQYHGYCADHYGGPGQNISGSDGIVDNPYVIDANNIDRYPLMRSRIVARVGDVNGDCVVGITDVILVFLNWGTVPPKDPTYDVNGDGVVGIADVIIVFLNWG